MILCDIGNSTFHFKTNKKDFKISVNDDLSKLRFKSKIYFISVNKKATKKLLKYFPNSVNLNSKFKIQTTYATTLGIDRIVAIQNIKNGIVVDFGSAITVDIIKKKKHLGGFIMPGIEMLKNNYPKISKKLKFDFVTNTNLDKIPLNTNEAINYGIINMIVLPIKNIQNQYNLSIIFTGENSKLILQYFKNYKYKKNLIFKNMKQLVKGLK